MARLSDTLRYAELNSVRVIETDEGLVLTSGDADLRRHAPDGFRITVKPRSPAGRALAALMADLRRHPDPPPWGWLLSDPEDRPRLLEWGAGERPHLMLRGPQEVRDTALADLLAQLADADGVELGWHHGPGSTEERLGVMMEEIERTIRDRLRGARTEELRRHPGPPLVAVVDIARRGGGLGPTLSDARWRGITEVALRGAAARVHLVTTLSQGVRAVPPRFAGCCTGVDVEERPEGIAVLDGDPERVLYLRS